MIVISKFLPYGKQYIDQEDIDEVVNVLNDDFITQGPKIPEFEEKIAKYVGAKHAVAFNSELLLYMVLILSLVLKRRMK